MNGFLQGIHPVKLLLALLVIGVVAGCGDGGNNYAPVAAPAVVTTVPANLATLVPTNRKISAQFSQAMLPATLNSSTAPGTFTLRETIAPGTAVTGTVSYDAASRIATFTPGVALTVSTGYTATINTTATSAVGVAMTSNHVWTFTTGLGADATAPKLISTNPVDTAVGVPVNQIITATFNEPMDPATICGPASLTAACPVASFTVTCVGP